MISESRSSKKVKIMYSRFQTLGNSFNTLYSNIEAGEDMQLSTSSISQVPWTGDWMALLQPEDGVESRAVIWAESGMEIKSGYHISTDLSYRGISEAGDIMS